MESNTIYLHIGLHKTGTTTIQNGLALNRKKLAGKGFYCLSAGCASASSVANHNLAYELGSHVRFREKNGTWQDALEEIQSNSEFQCFIISSEEFSSLDEENTIKLKKILSPYHVTVICYLRRQDQLLQSLWSQITKNGRNMLDFGEWLRKNNFLCARLNYREIVGRWEDAFGKSNIRLRILEKGQLKGHLLADFLDACGAPISSMKIRLPADRNPSPGIKTLTLSRYLNRYLHNRVSPEGKQVIMHWIQDYAHRHGWDREAPNLVTEKIYQATANKFSNSNRTVARKYFNREELFLEPFMERESSGFGIEDFPRKELSGILKEIFRMVNQPQLIAFWMGGVQSLDPMVENQKLKSILAEVQSSLLWRVMRGFGKTNFSGRESIH